MLALRKWPWPDWPMIGPMGGPQMSLFGDGAARPVPATDTLFFALQPDVATAQAIASFGARLRGQYALKGKVQAPGLMHVTLYFMGGFVGVPQDLVDRACGALAGFRVPAFDVCFDRVLSFRRKSNRPVVLVGGEALAPLCRFQGRLRAVLVAAHLPEPEKIAFNPHVTLLRDDREVPEQSIEPVCWTVREFVLVRSLQGRGRHEVLARFALRG